jgi:hypothetical protein
MAGPPPNVPAFEACSSACRSRARAARVCGGSDRSSRSTSTTTAALAARCATPCCGPSRWQRSGARRQVGRGLAVHGSTVDADSYAVDVLLCDLGHATHRTARRPRSASRRRRPRGTRLRRPRSGSPLSTREPLRPRSLHRVPRPLCRGMATNKHCHGAGVRRSAGTPAIPPQRTATRQITRKTFASRVGSNVSLVLRGEASPLRPGAG